MSKAYPPSPYSSPIGKQNLESHTLSVLVDNEPGVLARVVGLFSARSFNIESLTVAEVAHETHLSRITIATSGTPEVIEQVRHQLERLVPVHSVTDLTLAARSIASVNPLGQRTTTVYDAAGQTVASIDPLLRRSSTVYDPAGRSVASVDPLGHRTTTIYDAAGESIATAQVSGVLALMLAKNPGLSAAAALRLLRETSDATGSSKRVDACAAVVTLTHQGTCRTAADGDRPGQTSRDTRLATQ